MQYLRHPGEYILVIRTDGKLFRHPQETPIPTGHFKVLELKECYRKVKVSDGHPLDYCLWSLPRTSEIGR